MSKLTNCDKLQVWLFREFFAAGNGTVEQRFIKAVYFSRDELIIKMYEEKFKGIEWKQLKKSYLEKLAAEKL